MSGASGPTLVGSMAKISHPVYTRFIDHPFIPKPRPVEFENDIRDAARAAPYVELPCDKALDSQLGESLLRKLLGK